MIPHFSDSILTIDLSAIEQNYHSLAAIADMAQCAAVVKADAYGLGIDAVATRLFETGCQHFFVAHINEAITLRQLIGNEATIYVLHGVRMGQEATFVDAHLIPVINHLEQLTLWNAYAKGQSTILPAILHIDTGMNRLGISADEAANVSKNSAALSHIELKYVMSHLACSGEADHPLNQQQLERFSAVRALFPNVPATLSNSGGILLGKDYHFDLVRPGISLFGGYNHRPSPVYLRPVAAIRSKPLQIRTIDTIETIGYGATVTLPKGTVLATLPVGYADGYLRMLGNQSEVYYGDDKVPVVGRVSMDMIMVDITSLKNEKISTNSEFELLGEHYTIDDMADCANTIGYEILTRLGSRYQRHYVG